MFGAKAEAAPDTTSELVPASQYVLFEEAPLTGSQILQGAATRDFYAMWERQARVNGLPLLGEFDAEAASDKQPFLVIHRVHRRGDLAFELVYAGGEVSTIIGMSRKPRMLKPGPDSINTNDVHARLMDVTLNLHPHFCVKTLGWQGRDMTKYEVLLLPFGEAGFEGAVAVMSVMSFSSEFDPRFWRSPGS
ncbi:MAG: hypothetical protein AAGF81_04995 [Pseudomonadota bacterium]